MKYYSKRKQLNVKWLFFSGLLAASLYSTAQYRPAVIADAKLGKIAIKDLSGYQLDPVNIQQEQLINIDLPVETINHGKALPAGSCKIKIGLGSKLEMDPGFDLSKSGMGSYFKWTAVDNGGQVLVTGELIKELPANVNSVDLSLRVKASGEEGKSTITANFLITNHNTAAILSDEDGSNNSSFLAYRVAKKFDILNPATLGALQLGVYPNPAKDVSSVVIKVVQGKLNGKYKVNLYDITGQLVQSKELQMNYIKQFNYGVGTIAAGKYIINVSGGDANDSSILKFEKL